MLRNDMRNDIRSSAGKKMPTAGSGLAPNQQNCWCRSALATTRPGYSAHRNLVQIQNVDCRLSRNSRNGNPHLPKVDIPPRDPKYCV